MDAGIITEISYKKKRGLIMLDDGREAFFHKNCLYRSTKFENLVEGGKVKFYTQQSYNGYMAIEIQLLQ